MLIFLCIFVAILFPLAYALLFTIDKVASVCVSILPPVLAFAFRLPIRVVSVVMVPVGKLVTTGAVAQRIMPLTFVFVAVGPDVDSVAESHVVLPLADVTVSVVVAPDSVAVFLAFQPVAVVLITCGLPFVDAFALDAALRVKALVSIAVRKPLETCSFSLVVEPRALVVASISISDYAQA